MRCLAFFHLLIGSFATAGDLLHRYDFSGSGMATTFRISCYCEEQGNASRAVQKCYERIAELNARFTDYDPASELMRLCAPDASMPYAVSEPLYAILKKSVALANMTHGAFDPTCGHLSHLWRRTKRTGRLPPQDRLALAIASTDWKRIRVQEDARMVLLSPGTLIDLGGIAKGWAADECLRILKQEGIPKAIVQAGGDTVAGEAPPGQKGWEVMLTADKLSKTRILLCQRAVSTSGDLYQYVEIDGVRYSHIISPRTGLGLRERIACSVIAPDGATSDALATALCVMGKEAGQKWARQFPEVEVRFTKVNASP
jgi:thiamine biosynthesis lipoprotein